MSVLIRDMKMPDNCSECQLEYDQMLCRIVGYWYEQSYLDIGFDPSKDRLPECPLVDLPEHHGRLIDADTVTNKYGEWYTEEGPEEGFIGTIKDIINLVPTVIKSE